MLDVSSILTGRLPLQKTPLDLRRVVQQAADNARTQAAAKGIALTLELPKEAVPVHGDEARLEQVLSNLLSNALKFSEPGGSVGIRLVRDDATAVLSVFDTGSGIAPNFLAKVFDPFAQADQSPTRRTGGLGLGLAIVRHLVERHEGTVSGSSAGVGQGATFTVRLPLTSAEA